MSWIKLDDRFADHPKIIKAGPTAAWLFTCGLCYCAKYLTDGLIPKAQVRKLADIEDVKQNESKLVSVGLWEDAGDSWQVHDYLEYNMSREQSLALSAKRAEAGSRGGRPSKTKANGKQSESKSKAVPVPVPVPDTVPVPEPVPQHVNGLPAASRKKPRDNPPVTEETWLSYSEAYEERYQTKPIRNQKVNSQMVQFVQRIGVEEAPKLAAWFIWHNHFRYTNAGHTVGIMLMDCEKLHTEWVTNKRGTNHKAREEDRLQGTGDMWQELKEEFRNARTVRQLD